MNIHPPINALATALSECFEIMIQKTQGFRYTRGIYMRIFLNHLFFEALRPVKLRQYVADSSILASIMDNLQNILKFDLGKKTKSFTTA